MRRSPARSRRCIRPARARRWPRGIASTIPGPAEARRAQPVRHDLQRGDTEMCLTRRERLDSAVSIAREDAQSRAPHGVSVQGRAEDVEKGSFSRSQDRCPERPLTGESFEEGIGFVSRFTREGKELTALRCEDEPTSRAFVERGTKSLPQLPDLNVEGRLRNMKPMGRPPQAQFLGNSNKIAEMTQLHSSPFR